MDKYHLSVVVGSRNDNHGGQLLQRMQHFVSGFVSQCIKHQLSAELIIVDWNPPSNKLPLIHALEIPEETGPCAIRFIQVPPESHNQLENADRLPLFQMIAKNVGIRRARGKYVLATNIDILFSDELIIYLRDYLKEDCLYRVDRYDVPSDLPTSSSFNQILHFCKNHVFRVHTRKGSWIKKKGKWVKEKGRKKSRYWKRLFQYSKYPLRVLRISYKRNKRTIKKESDERRKDFVRLKQTCRIFFYETKLNKKIIFNKKLSFLLFFSMCLIIGLMKHSILWVRFLFTMVFLLSSLCFSLMVFVMAILKGVVFSSLLIFLDDVKNFFFCPTLGASVLSLLPKVHTNACGDFTLMSRNDWYKLKGYPEWPIYSWHIDSVLVYQALFNEIHVKAFDKSMKIYHIEHQTGSGFIPEKPAALFDRLQKKSIPRLSDEDLKKIIDEMKQKKINRIFPVFNDENWGLNRDLLLEEECHTSQEPSFEESDVKPAEIY